MKKRLLALILAVTMAFSLMACGNTAEETTPPAEKGDTPEVAATDTVEATEGTVDYSGYTIRIYTNGNAPATVERLTRMAAEAGFTISIDDNTVYNGADATLMAATENKDGDILLNLNDTLWAQLCAGKYEGITIAEYVPSWADLVGDYRYGNQAYGYSVENVLPIYRTDEYGTNGEVLKFDHWSDMIDSGYTWYRQNKVGGTTNTNVNSSLLYPYVDPNSEAGGISVEGWKMLWQYCAGGRVFTEDNYGFEPLNRADVQISSHFLSNIFGKVSDAATTSEHPLLGTTAPENWAVVDIADGTYYTCAFIGIIDRADRTPEETAAVQAYLEWFGSTDCLLATLEEVGAIYPVNSEAQEAAFPSGVPEIITIKNMALNPIPGTDMNYAQYVAEHITEWNNIQTNLGFFWSDVNNPPAEPDWDNIDWATITQSAG